jgi:hypothetical protein
MAPPPPPRLLRLIVATAQPLRVSTAQRLVLTSLGPKPLEPRYQRAQTPPPSRTGSGWNPTARTPRESSAGVNRALFRAHLLCLTWPWSGARGPALRPWLTDPGPGDIPFFSDTPSPTTPVIERVHLHRRTVPQTFPPSPSHITPWS